MEHEFWHDRWHKGETGWHRSDVHPELIAQWPKLGLPAKSRVLVPLCGATLDMAWLASQGHEVIGVELSRLAIETFLERHRVRHVVMEEPGFRTYLGGRYQLWCGDLFAMPADTLAGVTAVYDRASLIAFPPEMRQRYARFLSQRLSPGTKGLLITFVYNQSEMNGPPFSVPEDEVRRLLGAHFDIEKVETRDAIDTLMRKRGLSALAEQSYLLQRTSHGGDSA